MNSDNQSAQSNAQTASGYRKHDKIPPDVETVSAIHIASIIVMVLLVACLVYILKKHMIKFIGFYIVRRDY